MQVPLRLCCLRSNHNGQINLIEPQLCKGKDIISFMKNNEIQAMSCEICPIEAGKVDSKEKK